MPNKLHVGVATAILDDTPGTESETPRAKNHELQQLELKSHGFAAKGCNNSCPLWIDAEENL